MRFNKFEIMTILESHLSNDLNGDQREGTSAIKRDYSNDLSEHLAKEMN